LRLDRKDGAGHAEQAGAEEPKSTAVHSISGDIRACPARLR
jgi:hypothetical protein